MEQGTYLVLDASSLRALDVAGASDRAGTNVQVWAVNRSDAQIWAVTEQAGGWQLLCSLTGKCLDVAGGSIAAGTNVQQWSDNDGRAQRWVLEATGSTVTYQGTAYDTFSVLIAADTSLGLAASGTNAVLSATPAAWAFVPVPALTEGGTYELVPAVSESLRVDVSGGSKANGANLQVWSANGGNAQKFEASVDADSLTCVLANVGSEKVLDIAGGAATARSGSNVIQWQANGGENQSWLPVLDGTMRVNGNDVPTYQIRSAAANGLALDVAGGGTALRTNVQVWSVNGSLAQRFALVKTEVLGTSLPAPTKLSPTLAHGAGTVTLTPSFTCTATAYQARMRRTARMADGSTVVGEWQSCGDGSTARDGWGEAWLPTFEVARGGEVTMPLTLSESLTPSMPRVDWEVEVRAFSDTYGPTSSKAHGPSTVTTLSLVLDPTVTVGDVTLDLSGDPALVVPLSSDVPMDGNVATVMLHDADGLPLMAGPVPATVARSGSVMVPVDMLWGVPASGDEVTVAWTWLTTDGGLSSGSGAVTASYGTGPTATFADGPNLTDVVTTGADAVWLLVPHGDGAELAPMPGEGGTFRVCPPLNVPYTVLVASDAGVRAYERPPKASSGNWWVWGPGWAYAAHFEAQRGGRPSQTMGHSPDVAVLATSGRRLPIASANPSKGLDLSVAGYLRGEGQADFEALASALGRGMVPVYRTARGDWHRVAVKGVDLGWDRPTGNSLRVTQEAVQP